MPWKGDGGWRTPRPMSAWNARRSWRALLSSAGEWIGHSARLSRNHGRASARRGGRSIFSLNSPRVEAVVPAAAETARKLHATPEPRRASYVRDTVLDHTESQGCIVVPADSGGLASSSSLGGPFVPGPVDLIATLRSAMLMPRMRRVASPRPGRSGLQHMGGSGGWRVSPWERGLDRASLLRVSRWNPHDDRRRYQRQALISRGPGMAEARCDDAEDSRRAGF